MQNMDDLNKATQGRIQDFSKGAGQGPVKGTPGGYSKLARKIADLSYARKNIAYFVTLPKHCLLCYIAKAFYFVTLPKHCLL